MGIWDRSQLLANYIKSCEGELSAGLQVSRKTNLIVSDYFVSDYNMGFFSSYIKFALQIANTILCLLGFFLLSFFLNRYYARQISGGSPGVMDFAVSLDQLFPLLTKMALCFH